MRGRLNILSRALVLLPLAAPAWASRRELRAPDADEVLSQSLKPSASHYEGRLLVETFSGEEISAKEMTIRFSAPGKYRRELLDASGKTVQITVSDGRSEWIYDKARNKVWRKDAAGGPDNFPGAAQRKLLASNYELRISTGGRVARRPAWLLELVSRSEGKLVRRLWVDKKYGLILRGETFSPDGLPASSTRFTRLSFPKEADPGLFTFAPPPGAELIELPGLDRMALTEAKAATGLEPRAPLWLPSGYVPEGVDVMTRGRKKIIHFRFSDGVNVLSLFQCPPRVRLAFGPKGGKRVRLASINGTVALTPEGQSLAWSSGSSKFVLVGSLSPETLGRIAESVR